MPSEKQLLMGDRGLDASFDNKKIKNAVPSLTFEFNLEKGIDNLIKYYNELDSWNYDYTGVSLHTYLLDHAQRIESKLLVCATGEL